MKLVLCGHWMHLSYMHQWRQITNFIAQGYRCQKKPTSFDCFHVSLQSDSRCLSTLYAQTNLESWFVGLISKLDRNFFACKYQVVLFSALIGRVPVLSATLDPKCKKTASLPFFFCSFGQHGTLFLVVSFIVFFLVTSIHSCTRGSFVSLCVMESDSSRRFSCLSQEEKTALLENEPFSTAERSERVENFLFRATRKYMEAGIEQRCLGANSPEPRRRAVLWWHVSAQKTSSYINAHPWLPGLIVGPCPSEESLCCPGCPPPPFSSPILPPPPPPPVSKLCVSFPCICSPPVCIIRSVTSLSLATTTWTPEHLFFSTHCYPNTSSDITCVFVGGSFPVTTHGFPPKGLLLSGQGGCSRWPYQG